MKTTSLSIIALVILVTLFMGVNGYRLSGEAAARANPYVEKTARLIDQVDYSWGAVYMFQNDEHPVTAVSRKNLVLCGSPILRYTTTHNTIQSIRWVGLLLTNRKYQRLSLHLK